MTEKVQKITTKEMFNYFSNTSNKTITYQKYREIIKDFNSQLISMIIDEGYRFKIPCLNTELYVRRNTKNFKFDESGELIGSPGIDWKKTKELWEKNEECKNKKQLVRYDNSHTNNNVYRLYWNNYFANKADPQRFYKFKGARGTNRHLASVIKGKTKNEYYL